MSCLVKRVQSADVIASMIDKRTSGCYCLTICDVA